MERLDWGLQLDDKIIWSTVEHLTQGDEDDDDSDVEWLTGEEH